MRLFPLSAALAAILTAGSLPAVVIEENFKGYADYDPAHENWMFRGVGGEPFFVRSAKGAKITTCDGRELIDFVCSWGPALFGHNHPTIKSAIAATLENGTSYGIPCEGELEMAQLNSEMVR